MFDLGTSFWMHEMTILYFEKSTKVRINIDTLISLLISWMLFLSSHWWMWEFASQQVNMFDASLIYCTAFATAKNKSQSGIQNQNYLENKITSYKGIRMKNHFENNKYSGQMCSINIFFLLKKASREQILISYAFHSAWVILDFQCSSAFYFLLFSLPWLD